MAEKNSKSKSTETTPKQTGAKASATKDAKPVKTDLGAKSTTTAKPVKADSSTKSANNAKPASSKSTTKGEGTKATVKKSTTTADKDNSTKKVTSDKVAESKKTTSKTQTTTKTISGTTTKTADSTKATAAPKSTATKATNKATSTVAKKAEAKVEPKAAASKSASKVEKPVTAASSKSNTTKAEKPATKAKADDKVVAKADNKKPVAKETAKKDEVKTEIAKKSVKSSKNNANNDLVVASKVDKNDNINDKKAAKSSKIDFAGMFAFGKNKNAEQSPAKNDSKQNKVESKATKSVGKQDKTTGKKADKAPQLGNKTSFKDKLVAMVSGGKSDVKSKKVAKPDKSTSTNAGKTTFIGFFMENKIRLYAAIAVIVFIIFTLILSISLGVVSANNNKLPSTSTSNIKNNSLAAGSTYDYEYRTSAAVGYSAEVLGYIDRKLPSVTGKTEGFVSDNFYPKYGHTPSGITSAANAPVRDKLIAEAAYLASSDTRHNSGTSKHPYNSMDANGFLYNSTISGDVKTKNEVLDDNRIHRQLYKHKCAEGMYYGDVADDEKAIVKKMTFYPRSFHSHEMYNVTGIYAPAGEVIKIQISEEDMNNTGGLRIHIGQALYNRKANNIWTAKGQMQRFPVILNTMLINKATADYDEKTHTYTGYVGSFIGGPLYIYTSTKTFTATVSGGVPYSHFILGHTTPEEYEANKDTSAPYFDLEVWDNGVLHSGPKKHSTNLSYDDLFKVAVLWDKISSVTTYGSNQNIVFIYDPFVAAGAAVAFPGQYSVNCPDGWMRSSLSYDTLTKSGSWGNMHEYHHNFQGYGVGNGGEVTNNALTLVSYALFTKISSLRRIGSYGAEGLGGWNSYTNAIYTISQVNRIRDKSGASNGNMGLALYAALLHNFGADAFMEVRKAGGGQSYQNYFKKWEQITHNNMTFYFSDMLRANEVQPGSLTEQWIKENSNSNYPMFVPIASAYQTGRSYTYDNEKRYFKTMQPYVIAYGEKFDIDLSPYTMDSDNTYKSGSIVLPKGFSYKIKKITQPENGTITKIDNYHYQLSPNNELLTGEIYVTLEVTKDDHEFEVEDIDLILEFEQSHEIKGRILERTTYDFDGDIKYESAKDAFLSSYAGSTNVTTGNNVNPTQNSNTDIWLTPEELTNGLQHNSIMEVKGKLLITETGDYRIQIRGRSNVALFLSVNDIPAKNSDFQYSCEYNNTSGSANFPTVKKTNASGNTYNDQLEGTYIPLSLKAGDWIYLRAVMVVSKSNNKSSFIGVGIGKVPPLRPDVDEDGNPKEDADGNLLPDIQDPTSIGYANAYRESYQPPQNHLNPDYHYKKQYTYAYKETKEEIITDKQTVVQTNYVPQNANYPVENLVDGNDKTCIDTKDGTFSSTTDPNYKDPLYFTVKFDQPITASIVTIHLVKNREGARPKQLKLYISSNGTDWNLVYNTQNAGGADQKQVLQLDKLYTFQYYKLVIESSHWPHGNEIVLNRIEFTNKFLLNRGSYLPLGDKSIKLTGGWDIQKAVTRYGRVYVGKENSTISFDFTGNRLLLLSTMEYGNFEVYIDGKKVNSIDFEQTTTVTKTSYLSPQLNNKTHSVVIKLLGVANFEAIVTYNN